MLLAALLAVTPAALTGHAGVQVDDKVLVCGGMGLRNEGHFFSEAWLVDPVRGSWEPLPEPKLARGMAAAALLDRSIYLAGGLRWPNGPTGAVERFDLASRRWSSVAALRTPRSRLGLVTILGKLYAVSGMRTDSGRGSELNTASIEVYDPGTNTWQSAGSLNHARHGFASVVWCGKLYVFGGNDSSSERSAEVWDPKSGVSSDLPDMPVARGFPGSILIGNRVLLFGRRSSTAHPSAFNLESRTWKELSSADIQINRCVSALIGGRLFTIGGEAPRPAPIIQSFDAGTWR